MEEISKNEKRSLLAISTLKVMNPLFSSSATCVVLWRLKPALDSPIDFIADFPWHGRGGEQRKHESSAELIRKIEFCHFIDGVTGY